MVAKSTPYKFFSARIRASFRCDFDYALFEFSSNVLGIAHNPYHSNSFFTVT